MEQKISKIIYKNCISQMHTYTQNKIVNHLLIKGKKHTCENILLKSLKNLQKNSTKQSKKIIKFAIITSSPTFKLHTLTKKKRKKKTGKEIPAFINKIQIRISLAIKNILFTIKKKDKNNTYLKLKEEILMIAKNKSRIIESKSETQKQILNKKHLFRYYRWN